MGDEAVEEIQLVVFSLNDSLYGVDVRQVREITPMGQVTPVPGAPYFVDGVTNLRGQVTTVIDLKKRFGLGEEGGNGKERRMIIVEPKGIPVGMIVDSVTEVLRLESNAVEGTPDVLESSIDTRYIKGIGKLGDGRLLIIVDLEEILSGEVM
ncbi:MAG TPA: chemotaxis protein CheW [Candidatus Syntrophoarchaeum butanivorans]|uniref:Chemotaxis protein CheW n=1 Tax=Candidatus Syntropharchaeum butanivorans TaxID=1839936 RepID=A0A7C0X2R8_9EURY|nr:chemotaxis protein CheW [Candidatus Syntrophoarchaeum butanivorans]